MYSENDCDIFHISGSLAVYAMSVEEPTEDNDMTNDMKSLMSLTLLWLCSGDTTVDKWSKGWCLVAWCVVQCALYENDTELSALCNC